MQTEPETFVHAIRDCPLIKNNWLRLVKPTHWNAFFIMDLESWLTFNLKKDLARNKDGNWRLCLAFLVGCYEGEEIKLFSNPKPLY